MTIDTEQLRQLAQQATPGPWEWDGDPSNITEEYREQEAPFLITTDGTNVLFGDIKSYGLNDAHYIAAANPDAILALLDELDRLRKQVRQHEAFQQFANATEEQRLNDAKCEGYKKALAWAAKICERHGGWPAGEAAPVIRKQQPPAEWASSEQCGGAPNIADIDVRPQVQAFIEATKDVVVEHSEELAKHTVYAGNRFKQGCGKELADGQWWRFCGETDMGQTLPAICTECGGTYKLAESEWPHADGFGGGLMGGKE